MKLQDQVCTLEQAKKLKELGVKQQNNFKYNQNLYETERVGELDEGNWNQFTCMENQYSAFTVAELGLMLPISFISFKVTAGEEFSCTKLKENYPEIDFAFTSKFGNNEAEVRATMLIYLLENKLITVEEVNERLK